MSTQAAKRHAAREKRRRLLERVALVALAALTLILGLWPSLVETAVSAVAAAVL